MQFVRTIYQHILTRGRGLWSSLQSHWYDAWWKKLLFTVISLVAVLFIITYGIAVFYRISTSKQPLTFGVTFVADYARALSIDPQETMDALINDMGVRRFRLVSYWNKIEAEKGSYDFSELDWQFKKAEAANAKVSLAIGLRQPRWPECHMPSWAKDTPVTQWSPQLNSYITAVVNRYKDSPSLDSWQLENEYKLTAFGNCPDHSDKRLESEFALVKELDPKHPVIISRSNNNPGIIVRKPIPDIVGMSVYRRVWDGNLTKRYFTYPLPAWYYAFLAGTQKLATNKESMLHEMQMEPWPPRGQFIAEVPIEEQNKSFSAEEFDDRIDFAKRTGMKTIDLWGAEWWYWRKEVKNDPSFWNEASELFKEN